MSKAQLQSEESLLQPEQVTSTTANTRHRTTRVLLQTATVYAVNPENFRKIKVRVLFDSGSQRSYITSSLKSRLGLSTSKKETVHLNTFGQDQFKKQSCEGVRLDLQSLDGDFVIQMKALAFPVVCSPVATRLDVNEFQHLEGLEFADEIDGRSEMIDILLGADYYYKVVTGEIIKGDTGPTAVASKFGWLLTGPVKLHGAVPTYTAANLVINGNGATQLPGDNNHALTYALRKFWDLESLGIIETMEERDSCKTSNFRAQGTRLVYHGKTAKEN